MPIYDLSLSREALAKQLLSEVLAEHPELAERLAAAEAELASRKALTDEIGPDRRSARAEYVAWKSPENREALRDLVSQADAAKVLHEQAQTSLEAVRAEIAPLIRERWRAHYATLKADIRRIDDEIERLKTGTLRQAVQHKDKWGGVGNHLSVFMGF